MTDETDNSAVCPRDILLQFPQAQAKETEEEQNAAQEIDEDPAAKALLDLKDLFENKIAVKWTGSKR